ncbi:MAG: hypothetical protein QXT13_03525 [Pyrobaculum sp.]
MSKGNPFIEETESWKEEQKAKGRSAEEVERQAERAREVRKQIEQRAQQRWEEQRREEERRAEEEARRKAEEEARRRAEEEARRKAEEEARRRAEEEARRKAEEEARRRAEEEARKRAEAVARRMAEEERRRAQLIEATEEWRQGVAARGILSEEEAARIATLAQEFRPGAVQEMRRRAEERLAEEREMRRRAEERLAEEREMRRRAEEEARRKAEEEAAGVPSKAPEARPADELARELVERVGSVMERIRQAIESGDVDGLVKALKEAGIDKVKFPGWAGAGVQGGEIPVDQLRDVFERIRAVTRVSQSAVLSQLWFGLNANDVVAGVAKAMGLRVEPAGADRVKITDGRTYLIYDAYFKRFIGGGYEGEYVEKVLSDLRAIIEAGDVNALDSYLKSLPRGLAVNEPAIRAYTEFMRNYGRRIAQLQGELARQREWDIDRIRAIAEELNKTVSEALERYSKALSTGVPSGVYNTYSDIVSHLAQIRADVGRVLEVVNFQIALREAARAGDPVGVLQRMAALKPPPVLEVVRGGQGIDVRLTGAGYVVVNVGGRPAFAVDTAGRVFAVDNQGGLLNVEIPREAAGAVIQLVAKGVSPVTAASIARDISALARGEKSPGEVVYALKSIGADRIDLGGLKLEGNTLVLRQGDGEVRYKIVDLGQHVVLEGGVPRSSRPSVIVQTEYGPATLEAALSLADVPRVTAAIVRAYSRELAGVEVQPVKYGDVIVGFTVAPAIKRELEMPALVKVGGTLYPYVSPEGVVDKSHKFELVYKPTADGRISLQVKTPDGEVVKTVTTPGNLTDAVREIVGRWYEKRYGAGAWQFVNTAFSPGGGRQPTEEELRQYGRELADIMRGQVLGTAIGVSPAGQMIATGYGLAKGLMITDMLKLPVQIASLFATDAKSLLRTWDAFEKELARARSAEFTIGSTIGFLTLAGAALAASGGMAAPAVAAARGAASAGAGAAARAAVAALGETALQRALAGLRISSEFATGIGATAAAVGTAYESFVRGRNPAEVADEWISTVAVPQIISLAASAGQWATFGARIPGIQPVAPREIVARVNRALAEVYDSPPLKASVDRAGGLDALQKATAATEKLTINPGAVTEEELAALRRFVEGARKLADELGLGVKPNPANVSRDVEAVAEYYKALNAVYLHGIRNALKEAFKREIAGGDPERAAELLIRFRQVVERAEQLKSPEEVAARVRAFAEEAGLPPEVADRVAKQAAWGWSMGLAVMKRSVDEMFEELSPELRVLLTRAAHVRWPESLPGERLVLDVERAKKLLAARLGDEGLAETVAQYLRNENFVPGYAEYLKNPRPAESSQVLRVYEELRRRRIKPEELVEISKAARRAEPIPPVETPESSIAAVLISRPRSEVLKDLATKLADETDPAILKLPTPVRERLARLADRAREELVKAWIEMAGGGYRAAERFRTLIRRLFGADASKELDETLRELARRLVQPGRAEEARPAVAEETGKPAAGARAETVRPPMEVPRAAGRVEEVETGQSVWPRAVAVAEEGRAGGVLERARSMAEGARRLLEHRFETIRIFKPPESIKTLGPFSIASIAEVRAPVWMWGLGLPSLYMREIVLRAPQGEIAVYIPMPRAGVETTVAQKYVVVEQTAPEPKAYIATQTALYQIATPPREPAAYPAVGGAVARPVSGSPPWWWTPLRQYLSELYKLARQVELLRV